MVHSNGLIDPAFKRERAGLTKGITSRKNPGQRYQIPELRRIKGRVIGYRIPFDGEMVRYFIDPVAELGFGLVKAVDEWLTAHP